MKFIHSWPTFSSMKISSSRKNRNRGECWKRNSLHFAFVLFSSGWLFSHLSRAHMFSGACPFPPPSLFMVAVFHSAFTNLNFHWGKFSIFFSFDLRRIFHQKTFSLFTQTFVARWLSQNFQRFSDENRRENPVKFTFSPYHFAFRLSLLIHHSFFIGNFVRGQKFFHTFHTLALSLSVAPTTISLSTLRFSRTREKHFHSIKRTFRGFCAIKSFSRLCWWQSIYFTYFSILVNYFFLEWLHWWG